MPKIDAPENLFYSLLGRKMTDSELVDIFPVAKAELDGHDEENHIIKIELNDTNRPDLWSPAGVARALNTYMTGEIPYYDFFSTKDDEKDSDGREIINDESVIGIRDYSIGFACRGVEVDDDLLRNLIQSQEKLCTNFGRKRKTIAMGIYRSDMIKYPVHYAAVDPDKTRFQPLGMDETLSLREISEKHPKGKEYGYIVSSYDKWPYLYDDNGDTLSFPPVINSARIGAVEVGDSDFFIEVSGPILDDLLLAVNILACDFSDFGFEILPVKVRFAKDTPYGREITVPYYFQKPQKAELSLIRKKLGEPLSADDCIKSLARMGVYAIADNDNIYIDVPEYRNDFLHAVDIVEDVMIGYGLSNFKPVMPTDFTVGRLSTVEEFSRKIKDILVGLGFQEMIYNYLGSKKEYIDNMHIKGDDAVFIANPMSENYEVIRPSVLPSLLESESVSGHAVYPHNIFEVGKTVVKDPSDNSGTRTKNSLGFFSSDVQRTYNDVASYVQTLMYFLRKDYTLEPVDNDPRFIPGRAAYVMYNGMRAGIFGETHPQILESWGCSMPSVMAEFDVDILLSEKKDEKEDEKNDDPEDPELLANWAHKVILKVSKIVSVEKHPEGDKLYILKLDTGEPDQRTIVSSIVPYYTKEDLLGHNIVLVSNLKPANFRGVKSYGMLLAASDANDENHSTCEVIFPDEFDVGTVLEYEGQPETEKITTYLKADHFFALPMKTKDGFVTVNGKKIGKDGKFLKVKKYINGNVG